MPRLQSFAYPELAHSHTVLEVFFLQILRFGKNVHKPSVNFSIFQILPHHQTEGRSRITGISRPFKLLPRIRVNHRKSLSCKQIHYSNRNQSMLNKSLPFSP